MLIIRKKTLIRSLSFIFGILLLVLGLFLQKNSIQKVQKTENEKLIFSSLSSVCTSLDNICTSFEEASTFDTYKQESKKIYANCISAKNSIYYCNADLPNTLQWISELEEYSKSDMSDHEQNKKHSEKAAAARDLFVSICLNKNDSERFVKIEKFFDTKDSNYYNTKLEEINNSYLLLDNFIKKDRSDISKYAKKVLNFPIIPKKFSGNFENPPAISYSSDNSYAHIFSAGGFLKRMSVEETSSVKHYTEKGFDETALDYLKEHAPYAKKCEIVYTYKNTNLVYFILCPRMTENNVDFIDYTEPIKVAISIYDGKLKAFDASDYMRVHTKKEYPELTAIKPISDKIDNIDLSLVSEDYIYTKDGFLYLYKYLTQTKKAYYCTINITNNRKNIYTEKDFMRISGLI